MEKIRLIIYRYVLILSLASVAATLVNSSTQREFFYIAVYANIIGLFIENKYIHFNGFSIVLPVLLIGMMNLIWYVIYEYNYQGINYYNNYLNSGKKLILISILTFYLHQFKYHVNDNCFKRYFLITVVIGFILSSSYALWQSWHKVTRVSMSINRATVSSYIYSTLSFTLTYILYLKKRTQYYIISGCIALFSWYIILLTGTRSSIGYYLFLIITITFFNFLKFNKKLVLLFIILISGMIVKVYKPLILPKIIQTQTEIIQFQHGQDDTSLGARFSMWIIGIKNGLAHPLGQSIENRELWSQLYIKENCPYLATSLIYMHVHLHNEFIEKYSLQGIPGLLSSIFFYISIFFYALRKRNKLLLVVLFFSFIYSLTDVISLNSETIIFFILMFAFTLRFSQKNIN